MNVLLATAITCSTWMAVTTCTGPSGYVSHEQTWMGRTTGYDNRSEWSVTHQGDRTIIEERKQ